jgi:diguanylate cyclase (GGDEF)-like protein/PAS domain S-box-containing protein
MWRIVNEWFRGRVGVRLRLSLLALAAIVPLFALLIAGLAIDRALAVRTAQTHAMDLAQLIAERQAEGLEQAKTLLSVLKRTPGIVENRAGCHAMLQAVIGDQPELNTIGIVRSDGTIICHSFITELKAFSDPKFHQEVMHSDPSSFSISSFRIGGITGKPTIFVATPFGAADGNAANSGMIFASLNLSHFGKVAQQFVGSENWSVVVLESRTSTILARTPEVSSLLGKSFPDHPLVSLMAAARQNGGWTETVDFDGIRKIYGFAPLPFIGPSNLIVGVGLACSGVLADANKRMMIGLTIALIAAICAACGAWFLGDLWQLRPIQALVTAARKLGKGDLSARVEIATWHAPEFRALGRTLNEMAGDIATFEQLVIEHEAQYRLLAENATDVVFQLDLDLVRRYLSPACLEILGFTPDELLGTKPLEMVHPDDRVAVNAVFQSLIEGAVERTSMIYRMGHRDGHWVWVHSELRLLRDPRTKQPTGILGAMRNISTLKSAEDAVRESEARYRLLADNVADLIICLNLDLKPTYVSPASHHLIGCDPDELASRTLEDFALPEDRSFLKTALHFLQQKQQLDDFRFRVQHGDGRIRWIEMSGRKPASGDSIILVLHDITIRQMAEAQLEEANRQLRDIAAQDFLTGLANRRALEDRLDQEFRRAGRTKSSLAVIMIDVDRFKAYNDIYGHVAGDACLQKIAHAIKGAVQRPGDFAARYGGEEIAILLPDTNEDGAAVVAERIRVVISDLRIEHREGIGQIATISAGVAAIVPGRSAQTPAELINAADQALYLVKAAGRNAVALASRQAVMSLLQPRRRTSA